MNDRVPNWRLDTSRLNHVFLKIYGGGNSYMKWAGNSSEILNQTSIGDGSGRGPSFFYISSRTTLNVWSSISAKNRSLYSILDLLYFMLPYTMRHPTVLISWFNFSIAHGIFCFSHSISRIWHAKLTIFGYFY